MRSGLAIALLLGATIPAVFGEDIPLTACDGLPIIPVSIAGMKFSFLLDTAATSTLNLASFRRGDPQKIPVTSWNGTYTVQGQKVDISDLVIGEHHLRNLTLSAVDLSGIGRACGHFIDGILGIDLLRSLGAALDLKNRLARLPSDPETVQSRVAELDEKLALCTRAFNNADEQAFSGCLDPSAIIFTAIGDFYGREAFLEYLRQERSNRSGLPQLAITPGTHHLFGEQIWTELDLRVKLGHEVLRARGTVLCEKAGLVWRIVHLNLSEAPGDGATTRLARSAH